MEIKTTNQIWWSYNLDLNLTLVEALDKLERGENPAIKKWVALDDLKEWINEVDTDLTKEMILDKLSLDSLPKADKGKK